MSLLLHVAYIILLTLSLYLTPIQCRFEGSNDGELVMVNVVFRHGDRSPVSTFPNDPYYTFWPQGLGQLTQLGMQQQYDLGQFLRERYNGFLEESYSRHDTRVISTDVDRTRMSAEANLAGLYRPRGHQVWNPSIPWQPIPVHKAPTPDYILESYEICPRRITLEAEFRETDEYERQFEENVDVLEVIRDNIGEFNCTDEETGRPQSIFECYWFIADCVVCWRAHNLTLPEWLSPEAASRIVRLYDWLWAAQLHSDQSRRLLGGPLLGRLVTDTQSRVREPTSGPKLRLYSGHDTTVSPLLAALRVFNDLQPPYATALIMELWRRNGTAMNKNTNDYSIKLFLRNESYSNEVHPLTVLGCSATCSLPRFINLTRPYIPTDIATECAIPPPGVSYVFYLLSVALVACVAVVLGALIIWVFLKPRVKNRREYERLLGDTQSSGGSGDTTKLV